MISRTELCSQNTVFDVLLAGKHYYVFSFPIYDSLYVGKHLYPEDELYYLITAEVYARLISLTNLDAQELTDKCQRYVDDEIVEPVLFGHSKYEYIGCKKDFDGSEMSTVVQAVVRHVC